MSSQESPNLEYTIFCEDIRVEASGHLSLMGVLHQLLVPQLPVTVFKLAVLNHWQGPANGEAEGQYLTEVRILTPDRRQTIAVSQPSGFAVPAGGYTDNVTVFLNTVFHQPGSYVVQTLIDSNLFSEKLLPVLLPEPAAAMTESGQVN